MPHTVFSISHAKKLTNKSWFDITVSNSERVTLRQCMFE